ncbi:MAG: hypothetical protein R2817_05680 [Flavobacteriales bacterium]
MKLQFDPGQTYQLDAISAVVDLFEGQPQGRFRYGGDAPAVWTASSPGRNAPNWAWATPWPCPWKSSWRTSGPSSCATT